MGKPLLYAVILLWMMPDLSLGITHKNKGASRAMLSCSSSEQMEHTDLIKLYLSSENLVVQCFFLSGIKINENTEHTLSLLTSRGITPSITIKNSTYAGVFHFNLSQEKDEPTWSIEIPRKSITINEDINPVEEWFITITLQEGLETYVTEGTLLDLYREPILQWQIGLNVNPSIIRKILKHVLGLKIARDPCANDVAIVGIIIDETVSGYFFGVTFSGFWENKETFWYDVTSSICVVQNDDECQKSMLVDIVLTNYHLVVLSTMGLFISSDIRYPNDTLKFERMEFCGYNTGDYYKAKLWYNEICLANQEDFEDDYIAITFEKSRSMSQVNYCLKRSRLLVSIALLHFLSGKVASPNNSFVAVRRFKNKSPMTALRFPTFFFPSEFHTIIGMAFHPRTHFLYVFGNQIWISYDGANSFEIVGNFFDDVIISSYHSFHSKEIIFVSQASNLYFSKAGLKFYSKMGKSKLPIFELYYDHVGTEALVSMSEMTQDCIDLYSIFDNETVLQSNEDMDFKTVLAPQYLTTSQMIFFAYVPQNASMETRKNQIFYPHHEKKDNFVGLLKELKLLFDICLLFTLSKQLLRARPPGRYSSQFKNSDTHKTVVIPGYSSFLILEILNNTSVLALATMPVKVYTGMTFPSKSWFLYHFGTTNDSSTWSITTSSCKHVIVHDDVNTSTNIVKYLDLGSAFKFKIKVLSDMPYKIRVRTTPFLKILIGHVFLMDVTTYAYWDETDSYVVEMEIVNRYLSKGITTISFIIWQATADCLTSAIIMTLKSSCSYTKYMSILPKYKLSLEDWESGQYRDEHGFNIIKTLPNNYRPPSELGKDIPTTNNFYNADPSRPKLRNYHPQSKKTGIYKQCLNKTSREDCNCTTEQKMSQNVAFSDCTEKVVRFMYPVIQYPLFLKIKSEDSLIPMEAPYLVTISEVNERKNWKLNQKMTAETAKMREYLEKSISDTVYNPKDLNLSITGSELYHFRVKVIPGVTFCKLVTEFQIYVDNAPLPFPGRLLIASIAAVILGGIILAVFMVELFDIHIWLLLKNLVVRKNKVASSRSSFDVED
ncbi:cation channel sperm-associated protein subunit beta [Vombatus ursinus]|uniref:cation channel sperm-associated protein subunit beta n=1 Tax=Vombatus ursinus TaxID=29139 RepID=UPI000FFDBCC4|nr:cation channel sperm-associated protein subunit beta [Vombatus ursinus]